MVILIILLMFCSLSSMILSFILTGDSKLADDINKNIPDVIKKNLPDALVRDEEEAMKREYGKINKTLDEAEAARGKASNNTNDKRREEEEAKREADEAIRKFQQAKNDEEKAAAAKLLAEGIENARLAEEARKKAEAEETRKQEELQAAAAEAARQAKALATLKEGCKNVSWESVYTNGRPGMSDGPKFWDSTSVTTGGQTITEGMLRVVVARDGTQTTITENQMTGRNSRGQPTYAWRQKKQFAGYIAASDSSVGWFSMKKLPSANQPYSCRDARSRKSNCRYTPDKYNELHNFSDATKEYKLTFKDSRFGYLQGTTGKFYDIANNKVIDNPHKSECQSKLDYK